MTYVNLGNEYQEIQDDLYRTSKAVNREKTIPHKIFYIMTEQIKILYS